MMGSNLFEILRPPFFILRFPTRNGGPVPCVVGHTIPEKVGRFTFSKFFFEAYPSTNGKVCIAPTRIESSTINHLAKIKLNSVCVSQGVI